MNTGTIALLRASSVLALTVALLGGSATVASAHIQVAPTEVAPNDAVKFTVLVPGERAPKWTRKVVLKVPSTVLPYSFETTPGWSRKLIERPNHSIDQVVWTGHLAPDGFAEFSFLAATPPKPGVLTWKALQFYNDGDVVRWIGPPSSEQPAPQTRVDRSVAVENAGGEGGSKAPPGTAAPAAEESAAGSSSEDTDWLARAIALAALVAALALFATRKRRNGNERP